MPGPAMPVQLGRVAFVRQGGAGATVVGNQSHARSVRATTGCLPPSGAGDEPLPLPAVHAVPRRRGTLSG